MKKKKKDERALQNSNKPSGVRLNSSSSSFVQSLAFPVWMTLKGGTSQACAACKYQRRRCLPECQLAPYFPADQPKTFQNAHRLFGVSNILKILKQLDPRQRREAMRSVIYESDVREKCPVLGCYGYIHEMECRVQVAEEELQVVRSQIAFCKMQQQKQNDDHQQIMGDQDSTSLLQLGMGRPSGMMTFEKDQFWGHEGCGNNSINLMELQFAEDVQQQEILSNPNINSVPHFHGLRPFMDADAIDDRQSFVDSKVVYESGSSDSQGSSDHHPYMKNAAALT